MLRANIYDANKFNYKTVNGKAQRDEQGRNKMNCELMFTYDTPAEKNATKNGHIQNVCSMCIKINKVGKQEVGI